MNETAISFLAEYTEHHDASFLAENEAELYNTEYCIIPYEVCNAGVIFFDALFINDLEEEHFSDQSNVFLVSEISDAREEVKEYQETHF